MRLAHWSPPKTRERQQVSLALSTCGARDLSEDYGRWAGISDLGSLSAHQAPRAKIFAFESSRERLILGVQNAQVSHSELRLGLFDQMIYLMFHSDRERLAVYQYLVVSPLPQILMGNHLRWIKNPLSCQKRSTDGGVHVRSCIG